jgi:hypothetical protein
MKRRLTARDILEAILPPFILRLKMTLLTNSSVVIFGLGDRVVTAPSTGLMDDPGATQKEFSVVLLITTLTVFMPMQMPTGIIQDAMRRAPISVRKML